MDRVAGRAGLSVNTGDALVSSFDLHTHTDNRGESYLFMQCFIVVPVKDRSASYRSSSSSICTTRSAR